MDNVVKAEEVIDYSFGETKYNFTIEIIELEKLMISIFNGHTGVTYKTYLQKDDEKRLSLSALQAKMTYHQLIEFGYKLQKPKKKKTKTKAINEELI